MVTDFVTGRETGYFRIGGDNVVPKKPTVSESPIRGRFQGDDNEPIRTRHHRHLTLSRVSGRSLPSSIRTGLP